MHAHQQPRVRSDGVAVIVDAGAVGRACFYDARAGVRHDVGDSKAVADLDELAARNDDCAAGGELVQRQVNGGGAIVDQDGWGIEKTVQQRGGVGVALAAPSSVQVVLEVGVGLVRRGRTQGCATEVGMQDHAGGVDDADE